MYPLAPVSRMRDLSGTAAGFTVDVLGTMVSDLFTSDLLARFGLSEGGAIPPPPLPVLQLVLLHHLLHRILDQIAGRLVFHIARVLSQRFLDGGHRLGVLLSTHRN